MFQTDDEDSDWTVPPLAGGTVFRDGRRRVDFVLVYEASTVQRRPSLAATSSNPSLATNSAPSSQDKKLLKHEAWRKRFMANLRESGLQMEEVTFYTGFSKLYSIDRRLD